MTKSVVRVCAFLLVALSLAAQTNPVGVPTFGSFAGGPDVIDLANLNVHFTIPIVSKPGRGTPFIYDLSYDSWLWTPVQYSSWINDPNWGWTGRVEMASGYISYSVAQLDCNVGTRTDPFLYYYNQITYNGYTDPGGTFHSFGTSAIVYDDDTCSAYGSHPSLPYTANGATTDGSGYGAYVDAGYTRKLYPKSGGLIVPPLQNQTATAGTLIDYNGNVITSPDGNNFTDTLGTTALSISGIPSSGTVTYTYQTAASTAAVTVTYQSYTVHTTFGCYNVTDPTISTVWLPVTIARPEGSFQLVYEQTPGFPSGYTTARVSQLILPTGGKISYTYNSSACDGSTTSLTRTLSGGIDNSGTWTYSRSGNTTTVVDPTGNTTSLQFQGIYETERDIYQGAAAPQNLLQTIYTCYNGAAYPCNSTTIVEPIGQVAVVTSQNGMFKQNVAKYDAHGMVFETDVYDFGSASPGALMSKTSTTYGTIQNPIGTIYDRPTDVKTFEGDGTTVIAETQYIYDGSLSQTSGVPQHDYTNYPYTMTARGNLTSLKRWRNTDGAWLITSNTYDDLGNVLTTTDPGGHTTTFAYTDNYIDNTNHNTFAFITQRTLPNTGTAHIETERFYYPSGLPYQDIDQNNQTTTYQYDTSLRIVETDYADGGKTTVQYPPNSNQIWTWRYMDSTNHTDFRQHLDGLGRIDRTANNSSTTWEMTDTCFDSSGRTSFVSYPYADSAGWNDPKICSGAGDTYAYDGMSRPTTLSHSDGSHVDTSYYGRATQMVDEGNGTTRTTRVSQTDGLGRTTYVCEVTGSTLISSGSPAACGLDITGNPQGYVTSYSYSFDAALNSVVQVSQGTIGNRQFIYNSLEQLTQAYEPETWAATLYVFDSEGKLYQRIRPTANQSNTAMTTTTTYGYDALHRLKTVSYSDSTLPVSYNYDEPTAWSQNITNPNGRLTTAYAGALPGTAGSLFRYDPVGRVSANWQCTPSNCGSGAWYFPYSYDIGGDIISSSNGNGISYGYAYNPVARLTQVTSSYVDANHPGTLLSNIQYNALGVAGSDTLGNGFNESFGYNSRGQLLSVSATDPTATPASGTVTVNGSEQSQTTTSGSWAPGTGWIRIDGSEDSTVVCDDAGLHCHTVWNSGTVTITVNGHSDSTTYNSSSTNSTVAGGLVASINGDASAVVTASQNGNYVNLTSKTNGSSTNYSLSSSSSTNDFTDFGGPSFTTAQSGSTLTGGSSQTTTTTYDSGTVSVTVNGTTSSASYGQNDTASTVASSVAAAINANSPWVNAAASGNVITLTTKAAGTGHNYSFSSSNSGSFTPPSFSASTSGGNLTGSSGGTAYTLTTSFEPNGSLLSASDSTNGSWTFGYDPLNRLLSASKSGGTSFTFDTDRYSNRWHQNPVGQGAQLSFDTTSNHIAAGNGVSYDAAGNVTNDGVHTYSYDGEGRILQVDGGTTATYTYDAFGRRVRKATGSGTWDYMFDLDGIPITEVVAGTTTTNRTEVVVSGRHLATYNFGETYFVHADWLGTERVRTNHAAAITETCSSNPYGDAQQCQGTEVSPIHYAGMEYDGETGLYHALYRYYNPHLGLWMTPDPAGMAATDPADPQSLNRYSYAYNDPCGLTDVLGLKPCTLTAAFNVDFNQVPQTTRDAITDTYKNAGVNLTFVNGPAQMNIQTYTNLEGAALGYDPHGGNSVEIDSARIARFGVGLGVSSWNIQHATGVITAHELGHFLTGCVHTAGARDCGNTGVMAPGPEQGKNPFYMDISGASQFTAQQAAKIRARCKSLQAAPSTNSSPAQHPHRDPEDRPNPPRVNFLGGPGFMVCDFVLTEFGPVSRGCHYYY